MSQAPHSKAAIVTDRTQLDLIHRAWGLICNIADPRGPLNCIVPLGCEAFYRHVIVTMTATEPLMTILSAREVRLESIGYRAGPAGP